MKIYESNKSYKELSELAETSQVRAEMALKDPLSVACDSMHTAFTTPERNAADKEAVLSSVMSPPFSGHSMVQAQQREYIHDEGFFSTEIRWLLNKREGACTLVRDAVGKGEGAWGGSDRTTHTTDAYVFSTAVSMPLHIRPVADVERGTGQLKMDTVSIRVAGWHYLGTLLREMSRAIKRQRTIDDFDAIIDAYGDEFESEKWGRKILVKELEITDRHGVVQLFQRINEGDLDRDGNNNICYVYQIPEQDGTEKASIGFERDNTHLGYGGVSGMEEAQIMQLLRRGLAEAKVQREKK